MNFLFHFFTYKGRVTRSQFIVNVLAIYSPMIIFLLPANMLPLIILYILSFYTIIAFVLSIFQTIKRLHDINYPGYIFLFYFFPILNLLLIWSLIMMKGTEGPNKYGTSPSK